MSSSFIPNPFVVQSKDDVIPLFESLLDRSIANAQDFEQFLQDVSDLESALSEDMAWRYIKMTCDTQNKSLEEAFNFYCTELQPNIQPYADALNKKLVNHPLTNELDANQYFTYLRMVRKSIELFREENIPIQSELAVMQQQFGVISAKMTVTINGEEYTLQQAAKFFQIGTNFLLLCVFG